MSILSVGIERGREEGLRCGREEGLKSGREEGIRSKLKEQTARKLAKGKTAEIIAEELEEELPVIEQIIRELDGEQEKINQQVE